MSAAAWSFPVTVVSFGACISCGVEIVASSQLHTWRKKDGKNFYCINGHSQVFVIGETEEQRLKRVIEQKDREIKWAQESVASARSARDAADRRASAARGQVTKIRNRVGNGVCPCCNRTFQNVLRHMATKHPEFKAPESEP